MLRALFDIISSGTQLHVALNIKHKLFKLKVLCLDCWKIVINIVKRSFLPHAQP